MCVIDFDDPWRAYWQTLVAAARKTHVCDGCGTIIAVGAPYLKHKHISNDGEYWLEDACFACWEAMVQFNEAHRCVISPDYLADGLRECIGENDDADDVWRPVLAGVLRRYRTSPGRIARLRKARGAA